MVVLDRKITRDAQIEFSLKAILSIILGLIVAKLIGFPNVVTVPVTGFLVFWSNRSLRGSVEYAGMRIRLQIIFALADILVVYIGRMIFPDMEKWIFFILVSCIVVPIAVKAYYMKKDFMPLNLTAIFSNMIILAGLCNTYDYGRRRVLWNICGCLVGCFLAFCIPRSDKVMEVKKVLYEISDNALIELLKVIEYGKFEISPAYINGVLNDASVEMGSITAYFATITKDFTKSTKFPMRLIPVSVFSTKYRKYKTEIPKIGNMLASSQSLLDLIKYINTNKAELNSLDESSKKNFINAIDATVKAHRETLETFNTNGSSENKSNPEFKFIPKTEAEVLFLNSLLSYNLKVEAFSKSI